MQSEVYKGPPTVVVDKEGASLWFTGDRQPYLRILWSEIKLVSVWVVVVSELDYSEAFWILVGDRGKEFWAPVEVVGGAQEFNAKLFSLRQKEQGSTTQSVGTRRL